MEKLRRERINSSIEQLKSLLGPEFLKQEPDSKMEKADILEMTVDFLRQLQLSRHGNSVTGLTAANQGHSRCVQEMVHFLSKDEGKTQSNGRVLDHFQNHQSSSEPDMKVPVSPVKPSLGQQKPRASPSPWRPW